MLRHVPELFMDMVGKDCPSLCEIKERKTGEPGLHESGNLVGKQRASQERERLGGQKDLGL